MKLQSKIISIVIMLSLTANLVFVVLFFLSTYSQAINQLEEKIENNNILLNQVNSTPLYDTDVTKLETNLKSFLNDSEIISISLEEIDGPIKLYFEDSSPSIKKIIEEEVIIFYKEEEIGIVKTTYTRETLEKNITQSVLQIIASIILVIITISIVLYFFLRKVIKPITYLTELSTEIASGKLDKEINIVSNDEIGILAKSFTTMRDSIKQKMNSLKVENEERRHAETEVMKTKSYISSIIDSMPSILIGIDLEGKVSQWNIQAEHKIGITADSALGRPLNEIVPRLYSNKEIRIESIVKNRQLKTFKIHYEKDRKDVYEDVTVFPLVAEGVSGAVITIDNITEKIRLEEMIIQNEKMLSVGGLAAGMAHEINNPLAGLIQTANVITNRLYKKNLTANIRAADEAGTTLENIEKYLIARGIPRLFDNIHDSGLRASSIVNNMLSFARSGDFLGSGYNINQIIDKTLELASTDYSFKEDFDFKQISIEKDYDNNLPLVSCDEVKIQQVCLNLFRNGAQAMMIAGIEHPVIKVRTWQETESGKICISVEDNGPGMTEEVRKRIFEPFFTTKPVGIGTGLGLSVSFFIITENHNGDITVESSVGKGARFTIKLPLNSSLN